MDALICDVVIRAGQDCTMGRMVRGSVRGALLESDGELPDLTLSVSFQESTLGPRCLEGIGRKMAVPGATDLQWGIKWHYFVSRGGLAPLKELFMNGLDADLVDLAEEQISHMGSYWVIRCDPDDTAVTPMEPLVHSSEAFAHLFTESGQGAGTLYPKCSVGYSVGMISHAGRALRMTSSAVVVHTNGVMPPLGALVCLQFKISSPRGDQISLIRGTVRHRRAKEEQRGGMCVFEVRIRDAYDMDEHGALEAFMKELAERGASES
jgi:hypothetical protein